MAIFGTKLLLIGGSLGTTLPPAVATSQASGEAVRVLKRDSLRVIAPQGALPDRTLERVLFAAASLPEVSGLPAGILRRATITVSLARRLRPGVMAWTRAKESLVLIRLDDAVAWSSEVLVRTLRHELAHIGLARFVDHAEVPEWLSEGFSEWVAGGVSCEGRVRLHLSLLPSGVLEGSARGIESLEGLAEPRLRYDAYASFLEFLDSQPNAPVSSGRLLKHVRDVGADEGVLRTFGVGLNELVHLWQEFARSSYADVLEESSRSCVSQELKLPASTSRTGSAPRLVELGRCSLNADRGTLLTGPECCINSDCSQGSNVLPWRRWKFESMRSVVAARE